ncbi:MAG: hypothetical protein ACFFCE_19860 [Promethearchaeota archaeon]
MNSQKPIESLKFKRVKDFLNEYFLSKDFNYDEIIYVLKLENNKWWIGKSKYFLKQIESIKKGKTNKWIRENPVVSVKELIEDGDIVRITLDYMEEYGWENVQGSCWYDGQLDKYIPNKIKRYISEQKNLIIKD